MNRKNERRSFIKGATGVLASLGLGASAFVSEGRHQAESVALKEPFKSSNPLILFDNFHSGNRRSYSTKARIAAAEHAGFDGFEFVYMEPKTDWWKSTMDLIPNSKLSMWGLHWTSRAVVDKNASKINSDIERIEELVEECSKTKIEYISMSLQTSGELVGSTIYESGSAKAEDRHWERAYKIVSAFDKACEKFNIRGSLYPHTHWICDTPQSVEKILEGANAKHLGPSFCSHHWYANKNSVELDEVLKSPIMKRLNYVVLTNGKFVGNQFPAVRFDEGEIDMAWVLAKLMSFGYKGAISSQGWAIGGDPYIACKRFVDTINGLKKRFQNQPDLWPLN